MQIHGNHAGTATRVKMVSSAVSDFLGYSLYTNRLASLTAEVVDVIRSGDGGRGRWLACLNPHSYVVALDDDRFHAALKQAHWLIPDGMGVVIGSWILGLRVRERVCGPDAFQAISASLNANGAFTAMFIGATEETLALVRRRYEDEHPNARSVVTYSPPFLDEFTADDIDRMSSLIALHQPDVLWMGLSAPKQEKLLARLSVDAHFGFAAAIGAAFDFYAGQVVRSPGIFRRLGMEWLPRLAQQPRRLWRRMFVSAPIFMGHVLRARFGRVYPSR